MALSNNTPNIKALKICRGLEACSLKVHSYYKVALHCWGQGGGNLCNKNVFKPHFSYQPLQLTKCETIQDPDSRTAQSLTRIHNSVLCSKNDYTNVLSAGVPGFGHSKVLTRKT